MMYVVSWEYDEPVDEENLLSHIALYILQSGSHSMPMAAEPREPLYEGLTTHKDEHRSSHPVEKIMESSEYSAKNSLQENVYGSALAARAAIEHQVLNRYCGIPRVVFSSFCIGSLRVPRKSHRLE